MKTFAILIALLAVAGAGLYLLKQSNTISTDTTKASEQATPAPEEARLVYAADDFSWQIQDAPGSNDTDPRQFISLVVAGRTISVGQYKGCVVGKSDQVLEAGEVTRLQCWYGGAGEDIGVFKEGDGYIIKRRFVQEVPPGVDAPRQGPYEKLFTF